MLELKINPCRYLGKTEPPGMKGYNTLCNSFDICMHLFKFPSHWSANLIDLNEWINFRMSATLPWEYLIRPGELRACTRDQRMLRETEVPRCRGSESIHVALTKGCTTVCEKRGENSSLSLHKAERTRTVARSSQLREGWSLATSAPRKISFSKASLSCA